MQQLYFDLSSKPQASFDSFVLTQANGQMLAQLRALPDALLNHAANERYFYLWGVPSSGKTHLLQALCCAFKKNHQLFCYIDQHTALSAFEYTSNISCYCVDDCDAFSQKQQIALFNLFNELKTQTQTALAVTGKQAPIALSLREDLRTRLGSSLIFCIEELSDQDKVIALQRAAKKRGLSLTQAMTNYLLRHCQRNLSYLMQVLEALDYFSLEQKRPVTLPLLCQMLAQK